MHAIKHESAFSSNIVSPSHAACREWQKMVLFFSAPQCGAVCIHVAPCIYYCSNNTGADSSWTIGLACVHGQWQSTCLAHICMWTPAPTAHRQGKAVTNVRLHLLLFLICRNELITDKCPTPSRRGLGNWQYLVRQSSCKLFIQKCQCQGPKGSRELLQAAETS